MPPKPVPKEVPVLVAVPPNGAPNDSGFVAPKPKEGVVVVVVPNPPNPPKPELGWVAVVAVPKPLPKPPKPVLACEVVAAPNVPPNAGAG
jgi:hypothetical protein